MFTAAELVAAVRAAGSRLGEEFALELLEGPDGFRELGLVERRGGRYLVTEWGRRLSGELSIARLDATDALPIVEAVGRNIPHAGSFSDTLLTAESRGADP